MHLMNWSEFWRESRDGKFLPSPEKREIEALSSIRPVVESPGCRWVLPGGTRGVWRLVACLSLICCVPTTQHRWRCLLIPGPWSAPTPTMSFSCRPMVPSGPAHEPLSVGKWLIFLRGRILQEVCQAFFLNCAKTKCVVIRSMVLELERPEFETKFLPLKMDSSFSVSPFVTQWWSIWSP